jgi:hypothetical protein
MQRHRLCPDALPGITFLREAELAQFAASEERR